MLNVLGENYYVDLDEIESYIDMTDELPVEQTSGATEMRINIIKFEMVKMLMEVVLSENEELDEQTLWVVDILIPLLTIFPLIGVSIYILVDAVDRLGNPRGDVNTIYLFVFSGISLVVDSISVGMFVMQEDDLLSEEKVKNFFLHDF